MNLKEKWHALPEWQRVCVGILFIPVVPLAGVLALVAVILGLLIVTGMDIIEKVLDRIYGDDNEQQT